MLCFNSCVTSELWTPLFATFVGFTHVDTPWESNGGSVISSSERLCESWSYTPLSVIVSGISSVSCLFSCVLKIAVLSKHSSCVVYILYRSRSNTGSIVSDYGLDNWGSIPDRGRGFFF
jgi:hypothetical protein